jgi:hypothetical protein
MAVINYYVSKGCLISLSMCRSGFQDLFNATPELQAPPPRSDAGLFLPHVLTTGPHLGSLPSTACSSTRTRPLLVNPSFLLAQAILRRTFTCINIRTISCRLFFLHTPPMKMELTFCSETSAHKIQTPGNHPKERIQQSASSYADVQFYCFTISVVFYL